LYTNATLISSVPTTPVSTYVYVPAPLPSLSPSTRFAIRVVLDLDQADHVGVEPGDRVDDLRPLPRKLLGGVRAAAAQRREVVEHVERSDLHVAADRVVLRRARVRGRVAGALRRLNPVEAEREVEHARDVLQRVAAAETVHEVERRSVRVDRRIRVLGVAPVVERDPAEQVVLRQRRRLGGAGLVHRRRSELAAVGQHELVEAVEVEVLADRQRLVERDQHPLVWLPVAEGGDGKRHLGRGHGPVAGADGEVGHAADLRLAVELGHGSLHADDVAGVDRGGAGREHEDALRRLRVAVRIGVLLLYEEAVQPGRALVVAGDDALDHALAARHIAHRARALDRVDRRLLAVAADAERRRRRTAVRGARGDPAEQEVDVVAVRVGPVGAAGDALRSAVVAQPDARPLGVWRAGVAVVAHGVDEGRAEPEPDRVRIAVLDQVRVGRDVEVAVRRVRHIRADDVVVAVRQADAREVDRLVAGRSAAGAVDELHRVRIEVDRRGADVLQLQELRRVGRRLVVVDLVDHERVGGRRGARGRGQCEGRDQRGEGKSPHGGRQRTPPRAPSKVRALAPRR
jgi:hypothetical protein